jgi:hypothetical protein
MDGIGSRQHHCFLHTHIHPPPHPHPSTHTCLHTHIPPHKYKRASLSLSLSLPHTCLHTPTPPHTSNHGTQYASTPTYCTMEKGTVSVLGIAREFVCSHATFLFEHTTDLLSATMLSLDQDVDTASASPAAASVPAPSVTPHATHLSAACTHTLPPPESSTLFDQLSASAVTLLTDLFTPPSSPPAPTPSPLYALAEEPLGGTVEESCASGLTSHLLSSNSVVSSAASVASATTALSVASPDVTAAMTTGAMTATLHAQLEAFPYPTNALLHTANWPALSWHTFLACWFLCVFVRFTLRR